MPNPDFETSTVATRVSVKTLLRLLSSLVLGTAVLLFAASQAHAERIKDLVTIQGVRSNQLIGYGLVVGLDGTGDQTTQTPFTVQSITAMLSQMGTNLPPGTNLQVKNVAAVMITDGAARVRTSGPDHRRDGLVARQREEPARRHAAEHAA